MATSTDPLSTLLAFAGLDAYISRDRARQLLAFAGVGASGIPIDLVITTTAIPVVGVLTAQVIGWAVAASWNHAWNRWLTWQTDQPVYKTWLQYLVVDSGRLALRIGVVAALVYASAGTLVATIAGIGVATLAGFIGFDRVVFDD
ncbi:GtrA family protein [Halobacterium hubeiense]|uniref:GtrA family protein n=1 Tax=Halobacterium hubeiense TaxID=1407499 RepID=UPI003C793B4C